MGRGVEGGSCRGIDGRSVRPCRQERARLSHQMLLEPLHTWSSWSRASRAFSGLLEPARAFLESSGSWSQELASASRALLGSLLYTYISMHRRIRMFQCISTAVRAEGCVRAAICPRLRGSWLRLGRGGGLGGCCGLLVRVRGYGSFRGGYGMVYLRRINMDKMPCACLVNRCYMRKTPLARFGPGVLSPWCPMPF